MVCVFRFLFLSSNRGDFAIHVDPFSTCRNRSSQYIVFYCSQSTHSPSYGISFLRLYHCKFVPRYLDSYQTIPGRPDRWRIPVFSGLFQSLWARAIFGVRRIAIHVVGLITKLTIFEILESKPFHSMIFASSKIGITVLFLGRRLARKERKKESQSFFFSKQSVFCLLARGSARSE